MLTRQGMSEKEEEKQVLGSWALVMCGRDARYRDARWLRQPGVVDLGVNFESPYMHAWHGV